MSTYAELVKQIDELKAKAEKQRIAELTAIIAEIKEKIVTYNLTAQDLGLGKKAAQGGNGKTGKTVEAKYRHPSNPQLAWSGRGRQPKWVVAWIAEDAKHNVEDLLIKN